MDADHAMKDEANETALQRALRAGAEAAAVGFDWDVASDALDKVEEEVSELRAELGVHERAREELGDLLFAVVNVARKLGVDPEEALHEATMKFERRFALVLEQVAAQGARPEALTLDELEAMWQRAKTRGGSPP